MRSQPCADDVDGTIHAGEEAGEMSLAAGGTADDDLAFFLLRMLVVIEVDRMLVVEEGGGFTEGDAIFFFISCGFLIIPIEPEWFLFFHLTEYSMAVVWRKLMSVNAY